MTTKPATLATTARHRTDDRATMPTNTARECSIFRRPE
jgi:hypothetical protein